MDNMPGFMLYTKPVKGSFTKFREQDTKFFILCQYKSMDSKIKIQQVPYTIPGTI